MKFNIFANEFSIMTGEILKSLRLKAKLTQKELSEALNCDQSRISQWENGKYEISKAYKQLLEMYFKSLK